MALFKKKLEVVQAMEVMFGVLLSRDLDQSLSAFNQAGLLSDNEMARLEDEIPLLEITLWQIRFLETTEKKRIPISAEAVGFYSSVALTTAISKQLIGPESAEGLVALGKQLGDEGVESVEAMAESLVEGMGQYFNGLMEYGDDRVAKYGSEFSACQIFTDRVLPDVNLLDPADFNKHSEVFNIAKQVNDAQGFLLRELLSEYKLVHTGLRDV